MEAKRLVWVNSNECPWSHFDCPPKRQRPHISKYTIITDIFLAVELFWLVLVAKENQILTLKNLNETYKLLVGLNRYFLI